MAEPIVKKRWSAEQRLEFIEFVSFWEGAINRSQITDHFGVSTPQASNDLAAYQSLAPGNLRYDLSSKRYVAAREFACKLIEPDADRYLSRLTALTTHSVGNEESWLLDAPVAAVIPIPIRRVDSSILRDILRAVRLKRSVEVEYHSLNPSSDGPSWRRMTPHAFASDGFRWHVRAFCHRSARFKDFLLSRCCGARNETSPGARADDDTHWSTHFEVRLVPNPRLSDAQRKAVELDYGMQNGAVILPVRYALLYYFDKHLRIDLEPDTEKYRRPDARSTPVVVANVAEYKVALASVGVMRRSDN